MQEMTYIMLAYAISGVLLAALILSTITRARRIKKLTKVHEA